MERKAVGENLLRIIWYSIAQKVVEKAIIIYELDEEQADALRKAYLKINHYNVVST